MRILVTVCIVLLHLNLKGQSNINLLIPSEEITEDARRSTKSEIKKLQQRLSLTKKETRIKKFELCNCTYASDAMDKRGEKSLTPAGEFDQIEGCPAEYYFQHKTNRKDSHYVLTFFYDTEGNLIDTNIAWILIVH